MMHDVALTASIDSFAEWCNEMQAAGLVTSGNGIRASETNLKKMFHYLDLDKNGSLDVEEFVEFGLCVWMYSLSVSLLSSLSSLLFTPDVEELIEFGMCVWMYSLSVSLLSSLLFYSHLSRSRIDIIKGQTFASACNSLKFSHAHCLIFLYVSSTPTLPGGPAQ
jgi:hypothetical protein